MASPLPMEAPAQVMREMPSTPRTDLGFRTWFMFRMGSVGKLAQLYLSFSCLIFEPFLASQSLALE